MREIICGRSRHYTTRVSDEDYEFFVQWLWTFAVSHKGNETLIYIRRSISIRAPDTPRGWRSVTILMHRVCLEERMLIPPPSPRHTVHHIDGDSLNNQRTNLTWRSPAGQMAENRLRYARQAGQLDAPIDEIPF
jgi:hypothetical protein